MKRILILLTTLLISISTFAQNTQWFQAFSFAYKEAYSPSWSNWEPSTVKICFNFTNQTITIYSPQLQEYQVIQKLQPPYDPDGTQEKYLVRGRNGYNYVIRLRIEKTGNSQLYVDANDGSIVYNVRKI